MYLVTEAVALGDDLHLLTEEQRSWQLRVEQHIAWTTLGEHLLPIGQDAAFAANLARSYHTVGGIIGAFRAAIISHFATARTHQPLTEGAPLALTHTTRYPIVQGPMTRVSDQPAFALEVARAGGLPFLALALMSGKETDQLLAETQYLLGELPWGVGILGFVPIELRQQQLEAIRRYRPSWAIIAGGRPDQALALEHEGIPTYLHVPSPGLLRLFLRDGARRFIFEGRECGGHVGPRSSFVLWNSMIDVLLDELPVGTLGYQVLFAGGIHDSRSAAMVAAIAAPLIERGVEIGVLIGTAYLFTTEAVSSGAITAVFQQAALACTGTMLLESGPGHAVRCIPSTFVEHFDREKQRLRAEGASPDQLRQALEELTIGRLRIATKGITRPPMSNTSNASDNAARFVALSADEQRSQGMYMIGQVAALRHQVCTISELHYDIAVESLNQLHRMPLLQPLGRVTPRVEPAAIAIIGMSCVLPKAADLRGFWQNILNKTNAITEIPTDRWDWKLFFDSDRSARDKMYSRWGGFIDDVAFDPLEFGMPPNALPSIDPMQLLALKATKAALEDAGYQERSFARQRTSVIIGAGGGGSSLGERYLLRTGLRQMFGEQATTLIDAADYFPEWTEDSFAGVLMNVIAGRIANRFDLGWNELYRRCRLRFVVGSGASGSQRVEATQ
ncbi:hypothetical protein HC891_02845 [Candidatus Gracilibacteria bacterium]|nr:hypothetical protein [Candidatus Gracilibacteria bacterium]